MPNTYPYPDPFIVSIVGSSSYGVKIKNDQLQQKDWWSILIFDDQKDAENFDDKLGKTLGKAEKKFEKGKGDTSTPDEDGAFQVVLSSDFKSYVVSKDGTPVRTYSTEEEANAVANALNAKTKKTKKKKNCIDPDIFEEDQMGY